MTDRIDALKELLAKVEAGEFNKWTMKGTPLTAPQKKFSELAYNGSLDAAKALHEAVLPGWSFLVGGNSAKLWLPFDDIAVCIAGEESPAAIWLAAIIEALIAEGE